MDRKRTTAVTTGLLLCCLAGLAGLAALTDSGDRFQLSASDERLDAAILNSSSGGDGGIASQPCGDGLLSQSASNTITPGNTVQCINEFGVPAANGLARSFTIAADTAICGVQFGVQSNNNVGAWSVHVRLYQGDINGPFTNLELRGSKAVSIPPNVSQQLFTAIFDEPVAFSAGEKMVVELYMDSRVVDHGGDGGKLFLGSNTLGQTAPSYIRAPSCNLPNFLDYVGAGAPQVRLVMTVFTGEVTGPQTGACCIGSGDTPCPADLSNDGSVGVADLLALLSQWGPCPPAPAECSADLTESGSVGVADLLSLLSQWGPCPEGGGSTSCESLDAAACAAAGGQFFGAGTTCISPSICPTPQGACCLGAGACQSMTGGECAALGAVFKGDATSCANVICDQGPACPSGAIDPGEACGDDVNGGCFAPGQLAFTPISCGQSACGSVWAHNGQRDTDWYTITVNQQTQLTWSVDAPFQAQVAIINDQCGSGIKELAAGESEPGSSVTTASACLPPGTYRLFVAIDDFDNHPCGSGANNYVASLSCSSCEVPDPVGETCDDAIPVEIGGAAVGNNVDNDWKVDLYCDAFVEPESGVVWFEVVGDGNELTAFNANQPGTVFNTQMYVYCGSCAAQGCLGQQVQHPNQGAAYRWCSEAGHTYYLAVWGTIGSEGDISIGVTSGNSCSAEPCDAGGPCAGFCGLQTPGGCWCDDACHFLGDCCPGICTDCPEAGGCVHECIGNCGQQTLSGCWCGAGCELFGDCCPGVCDICPEQSACIEATCAGACGGGFPDGCYDDLSCICYCDDLCWDFGDCCDDLCDHCTSPFCP